MEPAEGMFLLLNFVCNLCFFFFFAETFRILVWRGFLRQISVTSPTCRNCMLLLSRHYAIHLCCCQFYQTCFTLARLTLCALVACRIFHDNNLIGTIPKEVGMLKNLEVLDLGMNQLSGPIPPEIGNLTNAIRMYEGFFNWLCRTGVECRWYILIFFLLFALYVQKSRVQWPDWHDASRTWKFKVSWGTSAGQE